MGSFYTNVTLRGPGQDQIAGYLASRNRQALVSPTVDTITIVYDALTESQDPRLLTNLGRELSAQLRCPALAALNHDEDLLWLQLHTSGKLLGEYHSAPGHLEDTSGTEPESGRAEAICAAFGVEDREEKVERILSRERDAAGYVSATKRHEELAEALCIPPKLATVGYEYLAAGEMASGFTAEEFVHTGPAPQPLARAARGPGGPTGGPGAPSEPSPGVGHIHIGPGGGCCGCLLAPLLIPLGLAASAWSAWVLSRHAEQTRGEQ